MGSIEKSLFHLLSAIRFSKSFVIFLIFSLFAESFSSFSHQPEMFNKGLIITMSMLPIVVVLDQLACVAGDEQAVWIMKRPSREQFDAFDGNKNGCVDWNEIETYFENVPEEFLESIRKNSDVHQNSFQQNQ